MIRMEIHSTITKMAIWIDLQEVAHTIVIMKAILFIPTSMWISSICLCLSFFIRSNDSRYSSRSYRSEYGWYLLLCRWIELVTWQAMKLSSICFYQEVERFIFLVVHRRGREWSALHRYGALVHRHLQNMRSNRMVFAFELSELLAISSTPKGEEEPERETKDSVVSFKEKSMKRREMKESIERGSSHHHHHHRRHHHRHHHSSSSVSSEKDPGASDSVPMNEVSPKMDQQSIKESNANTQEMNSMNEDLSGMPLLIWLSA